MNLTAAAGKVRDSYDDLLNWGLNYRGEPLGQLILTPRSNGTPFSAADYRLLDELVRQAGAAIYTARLTGALKHSREQLVLAREEERRRLRNELHDSLGPRMAGLIMKIETARSLELQGSENTSMLDELSSLIRGTVASMRRVVRDLRPPTLDQLGLVPAILELQSICRPPEAPFPVIRADMPPSLPRLPAAVEVALYRIAQEALTNVIRHAQAQSCQMRLWVESAPAQVCLQIRDDGGGFPGSERIGVGLSSMRERAAELGGECLIESIPGRGTTITASIPLK